MRTTLWRSLRGHAGRMVATGLAVLFSVAFIAGTFAFTDTARQGYFDTYARVAKGIDVSVRPVGGDARLSAAQLAAVRGVALLRLAWVSPRPCFLSPDVALLNQTLERMGHAPASSRVLAQFSCHVRTGLLYFPSQLRALERLVSGEDLYALLWDEEL